MRSVFLKKNGPIGLFTGGSILTVLKGRVIFLNHSSRSYSPPLAAIKKDDLHLSSQTGGEGYHVAFVSIPRMLAGGVVYHKEKY